MPLIYVTGIETAGKTTVCNELKKRGFEAYDSDEGVAHYYNKVTGERSEWLESPEERTETWHQQNDYSMDRSHVERLAEQAKNKPIFLCGTTQNDSAVLDLFNKVIYLYLDEATLKTRMTARKSGEFAFSPNEQAAILSWHKPSEDAYRKRGAVMLDATEPVSDVVKQILATVE